jgi:hypothetical protein
MTIKLIPRHQIPLQSSRYGACFVEPVISFHILPWLQITVADLLMDAAPPAELDDLRLLAMRVMNTNFATIHTRCADFHPEFRRDIPSDLAQ